MQALRRSAEGAIARIHQHGRFSGAAGLSRIRALCDALGNPQKRLRFVHIAGTNGKGSTAVMLAAVFQAAGYRTGLYTSPFLLTFHERMRVNGTLIADEDLIRLTERVEKAERTLDLPAGESIGEFEFVTALGFLYFAEQACDIVILETGLGGAFDATNIIDPPEAAVITPISLDHTAVLGDTVRKIAESKAGIIKPGSAVISAEGQPEDVLAVLRAACPAVLVAAPAAMVSCGMDGVHFTWQGLEYDIPMLGRHQVQNAQTALQTIAALRERGWRLAEKAVQDGLHTVVNMGRLEILRKSPTVIVDGCHNEAGVKAIESAVRDLSFPGRLHLVIGMVNDKAVKACASILGKLTDSIFVTAPESDRALPAPALAACLPNPAAVRGVYPQAAQAFSAALAQAAAEDTILICGSLYLVGEAKRFYGA